VAEDRRLYKNGKIRAVRADMFGLLTYLYGQQASSYVQANWYDNHFSYMQVRVLSSYSCNICFTNALQTMERYIPFVDITFVLIVLTYIILPLVKISIEIYKECKSDTDSVVDRQSILRNQ